MKNYFSAKVDLRPRVVAWPWAKDAVVAPPKKTLSRRDVLAMIENGEGICLADHGMKFCEVMEHFGITESAQIGFAGAPGEGSYSGSACWYYQLPDGAILRHGSGFDEGWQTTTLGRPGSRSFDKFEDEIAKRSFPV